MSTLGSKLRAVGQEILAYEAEKLIAQTEEAKSSANYWQKEARLWRTRYEEMQGRPNPWEPKVSNVTAEELSFCPVWCSMELLTSETPSSTRGHHDEEVRKPVGRTRPGHVYWNDRRSSSRGAQGFRR